MLRLLLVVLTLAAAALANPSMRFEEGLRRYRDNDMTGAVEAWQSLADQGVSSGALQFNLGNAYYRLGRIGKAIQCYERAKLLLPRDGDLQNNLELARLAAVDKIEHPIRLVIWNWVDRVRDYLSLRELAMLLQAGGFLLCVFLALWRLGPASLAIAVRKTAVVLAVIYGLAGCWYGWRSALDSRAYGIIMATKTDAYSAPDQGSKQVFSLHEGTKVRLGETIRGVRHGESVEGWTNIRLPDGRQGWIPTGQVERI